MKLTRITILFTILVFLGQSVARDIEKSRKIEKTYRFKNPNAKNIVIVDNVFGSVTVTGYNGQDVQVIARKTIKAKSDEKYNEGDERIYLDIAEEDALLELYVDGPFRNHGRRSRGWRGYRREGYSVQFDFEVRVPRNTHIEVRTVNDGEISIKEIDGDYEVHNVNGGIEMNKIGGSGDVYTVNGEVTVDFTRNPTKDSRYGSLNGETRLYFQDPLSADFTLKTFNGEVFSDFPVNYLPMKAETTEKKNGKYVYKTGRKTSVRTGKGGPSILLDGFNGDMFILKK